MDRLLAASEIRVLGALIEKEFVTPDNYPLSLNSLRLACNQKSSREPVASYGEREIEDALDSLREACLAIEMVSSDSRVSKYRHRAGQALGLGPEELAVLCVLMLRGPQTVNEIKTRTARMVDFSANSAAMKALERLMVREGGPLAELVPRQPGQKEVRYRHLLLDPAQAGDDPASEDGGGGGGGDLGAFGDGEPSGGATGNDSRGGGRVAELEAEIHDLREEMAAFRREFEAFKRQFD
jgi:uncharacterized protein YceH (UPF0502 family)